MKKIQVGDVFEIITPKGKGYFQYVYNNKIIGQLIRILPGLFSEQPNDMLAIVKEKELYFVHFPLKEAYKQGIVKLVGNYNLPQNLKLPKQMRSKNVDKDGNFKSWHIIDYNTWQRLSVTELNEEQKKLSPWGTWNDTLLIEKLVSGWTLEEWI